MSGFKDQKAVVKPGQKSVLYKGQVGAFSNKANADRLKKELNERGYPAIVVKG